MNSSSVLPATKKRGASFAWYVSRGAALRSAHMAAKITHRNHTRSERSFIDIPWCPATCGSSKQRRTSTRMTAATQFSHFAASLPACVPAPGLAPVVPSSRVSSAIHSSTTTSSPTSTFSRAVSRSEETEHAHPPPTTHRNTVDRRH